MVNKKIIEQKLLKQSVGMMFLVAVGGTVVGTISNSRAITLDGVFSFIAVIIKLMMLGTSKLTQNETSKRFQFGYWHFEPLVLIAEGSFTLIILGYALFSGILSLLSHGNQMDFNIAIFYALFFTISDSVYYFYVRYVNKKLKSNLVRYDNISWSIDAKSSISLLFSFAIAWVLSRTEWRYLSVYVDPIILIVMSIQMLPSTLKILIPSVKQILMVAPQNLHNHVQHVMDKFMAYYSFKDYVSSVQVYGNTQIIEINILVDRDFNVGSVADLDKIRNEIDRELGYGHLTEWLTITFTSSEKWMAKDYLVNDR
ncbi:cation diffusion facilitator family transporter [Sporolactobacillus sp. KGMB 08714]|uniref:cation diffusion facilitator family transporter n=1 Tax=Sporolactobacillus sp. KGMB 08714 TaxID=3064704 RepID=UPI002FBE3DC0